MTFKEAKEAIKELASGAYHSVRFELNEFEGGHTKAQCRAYIAGIGWSEEYPDFEMVISAMQHMIEQHENPDKQDDMFPTIN